MQKLLLITSLGLFVGLSACNDDDEKTSGSLSKTEAKAEISSFNSTAVDDLQDLADAPGLAALTDLSELTSDSDPFGGRTSTDRKKLKKFLQVKGHAFRSVVDKRYSASGRANADEPFVFDDNTGVYVWNETEQQFVRTGDSQIIKIQFPSEGSATNNAELQLKAYEETLTEDEAESIYEPSKIDASLLVNGTEAASLNLVVTWDSKGFPTSGSITAKVNPFASTVKFDVSGSDKNTLSASLTRDQKTLFSTSVVVLYSNSAKQEDDLKTISGSVQLIDLKLEGNIDVAGMDAATEPDMNQFVKLKITTDNKTVGDIVFVKETVDGYEESVAYIQYADGSKEKLEDVLKPVSDELDQIGEDFGG